MKVLPNVGGAQLEQVLPRTKQPLKASSLLQKPIRTSHMGMGIQSSQQQFKALEVRSVDVMIPPPVVAQQVQIPTLVMTRS